MAIDAGVALKVVVAGLEREQGGTFTTAHIGNISQALAHVVGQCDISAFILAPHELHTIVLAVQTVAGHLVDNLVVVHLDDAATRLHEHIARCTAVVEDKRPILDSVAYDIDGVTASAQVMHLDILVVKTIVTADIAIDDLVVLDINLFMPVGRVKTDVHATCCHITDVELVVSHVEITGITAVLAHFVVGHQGEQHTAVGLGILLVLPLVFTVMELVVLHKDIGAAGLAADILGSIIDHTVKDAQGLVLAILVELVVHDPDVVHLTSYPQAAARVAVVVISDVTTCYSDIGAHMHIEIGDIGVSHITVHIVDVHTIAMVDLHSIALDTFIRPPDALVILEPEGDVAD